MQSALRHLQQAEQELKVADQDKGGHRVKAIDLINQAQREVQAGIQYDNQHKTEGEMGPGPQIGPGAQNVRITNGPVIEMLDDNSAVIAWSTNVQGNPRLEYGTNARNLTRWAEAPWGQVGLTQRIRVDKLMPDTVYFFNIETGQGRGTGSEVEGARVYSFRTLPNGALAVRNQSAALSDTR